MNERDDPPTRRMLPEVGERLAASVEARLAAELEAALKLVTEPIAAPAREDGAPGPAPAHPPVAASSPAAVPAAAIAPLAPMAPPQAASPARAAPTDPRAGLAAGTPPGEVPDDARDAAGDGGIPMLTDVLHLPRYQDSELPASLAAVDWASFALRVQENVLERMMRRSEALLDAHLQPTLKVVLERATRTLALELNDAMSQLIRDLVARAVGEELNRVHAEITRRAPGPPEAG
jgi:2-oxoglutarate dehydrogenase E2 component (dihydrolipoamide succinyltransferase)